MRTLNKGIAARYQQENHVTRYPVILYRSVHKTQNVNGGLAKRNIVLRFADVLRFAVPMDRKT